MFLSLDLFKASQFSKIENNILLCNFLIFSLLYCFMIVTFKNNNCFKIWRDFIVFLILRTESY